MENVVKSFPVRRTPRSVSFLVLLFLLNFSNPTSQASAYSFVLLSRLKMDTEPSGSFSGTV